MDTRPDLYLILRFFCVPLEEAHVPLVVRVPHFENHWYRPFQWDTIYGREVISAWNSCLIILLRPEEGDKKQSFPIIVSKGWIFKKEDWDLVEPMRRVMAPQGMPLQWRTLEEWQEYYIYLGIQNKNISNHQSLQSIDMSQVYVTGLACANGVCASDVMSRNVKTPSLEKPVDTTDGEL